ncbi:hypothetical protein VIGAN_01070900 [Vigna angularis var. angularis]|uniref:Uncharacterized protein n=1 Tax=Vigna angularis var. angularis TaxID=157739 RepID=A0A0S3QY16_PHAAN|nr:hypothetical protein VIGAN_01070900 [Vigna angularis var. angularis]
MSGNNGAGNGSGQGPPVRRPHPAGTFGNVPPNRAETRKSIIMEIIGRTSSVSSPRFCTCSSFVRDNVCCDFPLLSKQ